MARRFLPLMLLVIAALGMQIQTAYGSESGSSDSIANEINNLAAESDVDQVRSDNIKAEANFARSQTHILDHQARVIKYHIGQLKTHNRIAKEKEEKLGHELIAVDKRVRIEKVEQRKLAVQNRHLNYELRRLTLQMNHLRADLNRISSSKSSLRRDIAHESQQNLRFQRMIREAKVELMRERVKLHQLAMRRLRERQRSRVLRHKFAAIKRLIHND